MFACVHRRYVASTDHSNFSQILRKALADTVIAGDLHERWRNELRMSFGKCCRKARLGV